MVQPLSKKVWQFLKKLNSYHLTSSTPEHLLKRNENTRPHKDFHMKDQSSIILNNQKVETNQMSRNRWMKILWYIHTAEYYSTLQRNESTDTCYSVDEP